MSESTGKGISTTLVGLMETLTAEDKRELVKAGVELHLDQEARAMEGARQDGVLNRRLKQIEELSEMADRTGTEVDATLTIGTGQTGDTMKVEIRKRPSVKTRILGNR